MDSSMIQTLIIFGGGVMFSLLILLGGLAMKLQVKTREKLGVKGDDRFKIFTYKG